MSKSAEKSQQQQPLQNKATNIFDLNEYCLINVFQYLEHPDLVNVKQSDANGDFDTAIYHVVRKGLYKLKITDLDNYHTTKQEITEITNFLQLFGNYLTKLSINLVETQCDCDCWNKTAFSIMSINIENLIENFCRDACFKSCVFSNFILQPKFFARNAKLFDSTEEVNIRVFDGDERDTFVVSQVFKVFPNLKALYIKDEFSGHIDHENLLLEVASSQLEVFHSDREFSIPRNSPINQTLKELKCFSFMNGFDGNVLPEKFPNIENLSFEWMDDPAGLLHIVRTLCSLQYVDLGLINYNLVEIETILLEVVKRNKLKSLKLRHVNLNTILFIRMDEYICERICQHLARMTNLEQLVLRLQHNIGKYLPRLAKKLKNLTQFDLICFGRDKIIFDAVLMKQLLDFVKHATKIVRMRLSFALVNFDPDAFYDEIVKIRQIQGSKKRLKISVYDNKIPVPYDEIDMRIPSFQMSNKYVEMAVYRDE